MRWVLLVLLAGTMAGCVDSGRPPQDEPSPTLAAVEEVEALRSPVELARADVEWIGTGTVDLGIDVPSGTHHLAAAIRANGMGAIATVHEATIRMEGCPEAQLRNRGAAVGVGVAVGGSASWCEGVAAGAGTVHWTLDRGLFVGRVCIGAIPDPAFDPEPFRC